MKFTKEEAIKALEAMVPAKDKDLDLGRTIREAVENGCEMVGDESEMELDKFASIVFKQVKTAIGLAHKENSNVAKQMQERIAELERQVAKPEHDADGNKPSDDMQKLLDRLAALEADKAQKELQSAIAEKKSSLERKIIEGGVKNKDWVKTMLNEVSIDENTDIDAKAKDLVAIYNKFSANETSTMTPKGADGKSNETYTKDTLEKAKALMQQKNALMGGSPVTTQTV